MPQSRTKDILKPFNFNFATLHCQVQRQLQKEWRQLSHLCLNKRWILIETGEQEFLTLNSLHYHLSQNASVSEDATSSEPFCSIIASDADVMRTSVMHAGDVRVRKPAAASVELSKKEAPFVDSTQALANRSKRSSDSGSITFDIATPL